VAWIDGQGVRDSCRFCIRERDGWHDECQKVRFEFFFFLFSKRHITHETRDSSERASDDHDVLRPNLECPSSCLPSFEKKEKKR
jgi:hypothetical protein